MDRVIYERIQKLCDYHDITLKKLSEDTGIALSTMSDWKTKSTKYDNIVILANYFKVSSDYLIGISESPLSCKFSEDIERVIGYVQKNVDTKKEADFVIAILEALHKLK